MATGRKKPRKPAPMDDNERNLRQLLVFLETVGDFRLGLATYDTVTTRDRVLNDLRERAKAQGIYLSTVDLQPTPKETQLLTRLAQRLQEDPAPPGMSPALMVIGIESAMDYGPDERRKNFIKGGEILWTANFQRDAFVDACPCPVVLWLTPFATGTLGRVAPDLWHWRTGSFEFHGPPEARQELARTLIEQPAGEIWFLDTVALRGRLQMLRDLLAEAEASGDAGGAGQRHRAALRFEIALTLQNLGQDAEAVPLFLDALRHAQDIGERHSEARIQSRLGDSYRILRRLDDAITSYRAALEIARQTKNPGIEVWSLMELSDTLRWSGRLPEALSAAEDAVQRCEAVAAAHPGSADAMRDVSASLDRVGDVEVELGRLEPALSSYRRSLEIREHLLAEYGERPESLRDLSASLDRVGDVEVELGRLEPALKSYRRSLEIREHLLAEYGERPESLRNVSVSLNKVGDVEVELGRLEPALSSYRRSLEIRDRLLAEYGERPESLRDLMISYFKMSQVTEPSEALAWLERARGLLERIEEKGWAVSQTVEQRRGIEGEIARRTRELEAGAT